MAQLLLDQPTTENFNETQTATLAPEDQFERYDTINTPKIVVIGFVSAIVTFAVIVGAQAMFFAANKAEIAKKEVQVADEIVPDAITQQQNKLSTYGWVDSQKGVVSIPVADAMRLIVEEERTRQGE